MLLRRILITSVFAFLLTGCSCLDWGVCPRLFPRADL